MVLQWFRYAKMYRAKVGPLSDDDIYTLLSKLTSNADLAVLFESFRQLPELEKLGKRMQSVVFRKWIRGEMRPDAVAGQLGLESSASALLKMDLRCKIHEDYAVEFVKDLHRKAFREHFIRLGAAKAS
ncbi:hypothetical protein PHYPSEUDO_013039 [Phytophthora pseudosyringae]|uniref:RXLR phytopathogen effector protein WY-domain domain-containing protein n=1 Tax=Phytophthora pseudosyringae TaxID=221518 RepID=A0A8T1V6G0_9STRA|nr:hypothetical protein PHYPSEUDO_013039 [Phytophthora pseudosyringae]